MNNKFFFLIFFICLILLVCDNNEELFKNNDIKPQQIQIVNEEINHSLDPSIYVNEKELDFFSNVQYDSNFTNEDTKKIIRIFKQIGLNFNPKYGLQLDKNTSSNINISWNIEYGNIYTIHSNNQSTKPIMTKNNGEILNNNDGYYVFSFGYNNIIKYDDFEVYYYIDNNNIFPLYRNGKIVNTLENMILKID